MIVQQLQDLSQDVPNLRGNLELEFGLQSLQQARDDAQSQLDKMSRDRIGVIEHGKRQSKTIVELKTERDSLKVNLLYFVIVHIHPHTQYRIAGNFRGFYFHCFRYAEPQTKN